MNDFKRWVRDAGARAARTALGTFASMMLAGPALDLALAEQAAIVAMTSGASVLLALIARWAGDPGSASFRDGE